MRYKALTAVRCPFLPWLCGPLQVSHLRASIDCGLQHEHSLAAWRQLLLLVLLHDPTTVKAGQLAPVGGQAVGVECWGPLGSASHLDWAC